jgi:hypothetical protein
MVRTKIISKIRFSQPALRDCSREKRKWKKKEEKRMMCIHLPRILLPSFAPSAKARAR